MLVPAASTARVAWHAAPNPQSGDKSPHSKEVRPGIEPGPRPYHGRVLPEHLQTVVVTEVGVEPTGTRPSTSPLCRFAYPVIKWRVRVLHPASEAHEALLSTGSPALCPTRPVTKGRVELPRPKGTTV
jgi:hypothetical protein